MSKHWYQFTHRWSWPGGVTGFLSTLLATLALYRWRYCFTAARWRPLGRAGLGRGRRAGTWEQTSTEVIIPITNQFMRQTLQFKKSNPALGTSLTLKSTETVALTGVWCFWQCTIGMRWLLWKVLEWILSSPIFSHGFHRSSTRLC